jgi:hypothetical protein
MFIRLFIWLLLLCIAAQTGALTETFQNAAGTINLNYPQDWVVRETSSGDIVLSSNPYMLDAFLAGESLTEQFYNEAFVWIEEPDRASAHYDGLEKTDSLKDAFRLILSSPNFINGGFDSDYAEFVGVAGHLALRVPNTQSDSYLMVVHIDDRYMVITAHVVWYYEAQILKILDTLRVSRKGDQ